MRALAIVAALALVGCASSPQKTVPVQTDPSKPFMVDCRYAAQNVLTAEKTLYDIRKVPTNQWGQAERQQVAWAKTMIWTVRMQCPGY